MSNNLLVGVLAHAVVVVSIGYFAFVGAIPPADAILGIAAVAGVALPSTLSLK